MTECEPEVEVASDVDDDDDFEDSMDSGAEENEEGAFNEEDFNVNFYLIFNGT